MKPLSYRQIKRKLERAGFNVVHQRGSHVKFVRKNEGEVRTVIVPNHREVRNWDTTHYFTPCGTNSR